MESMPRVEDTQLIEPTPEEITLLVQNQILKSCKKPSFNNFLLAFKQNNFSTLKYFKAVLNHLKSNKKLSDNNLFKLLLKIEMAENMLLAGATMQEIKQQTALPRKLLGLLVRKYYKQIPKEIIHMKLIHYRLMNTVKTLNTLYKKVLADYCPEDKKDFVENFYDTMVDFATMDKKSIHNLELYAQVLGEL